MTQELRQGKEWWYEKTKAPSFLMKAMEVYIFGMYLWDLGRINKFKIRQICNTKSSQVHFMARQLTRDYTFTFQQLNKEYSSPSLQQPCFWPVIGCHREVAFYLRELIVPQHIHCCILVHRHQTLFVLFFFASCTWLCCFFLLHLVFLWLPSYKYTNFLSSKTVWRCHCIYAIDIN